MAEKPRVACNPDGIPEELRKLPHWVAFDYTSPRKPGGKHGKVPIEPRTGRKASTTNFATWGTCAQALECAKKSNLGGIGFVFTGSGYVGVDLDNCRDPETGVIDPWALEIIAQCNTYTEVSPSGKGVHCIMRGKLPGPGRKKGNIELYDTGRYFTMTGVRVEGTPAGIADGQAAIDATLLGFQRRTSGGLLEPTLPKAARKATSRAQASDANSPSDTAEPPLTDEDLNTWLEDPEFAALWRGDAAKYPSQSEADLRLCGMIGRKVAHDPGRIDAIFRRSGLFRAKWDERRGEQTYGEKTVCFVVDEAQQAAAEQTKDDPTAQSVWQDFRVARALTDSGNAERLVKRYGKNLRYCAEWGKWLIFKGGRWQIDVPNDVLRASKLIARSIYAEAEYAKTTEARDQILGWAKASEKAERRKAMVSLAQSERDIPVRVRDLDTHPFLLNCKNGTLDLRTGKLSTHQLDHYLTKACTTAYVPSAACDRWKKFLERMLPDDDIRAYLKRFAGYALTGDVGEQIMLFALGSGDNGKSTLANVFQRVMTTDYAIQVPSDFLLSKNQRGHPTDIADLFGVRFACGTETARDQTLDEVLVKQLTGGDPLRARRMREDFWQFDPTHKLFLLTNHMPRIVGREHAIWRRLHRIDFDVRIRPEEKDRNLLFKLMEEREGILAWMAEGARDWHEQGLNPPDGVALRPTAAQAPLAPVEVFASIYVLAQPGVRTGAAELFDAYCAWSKANEQPITSRHEFGALLGRRGHGKKKSVGVMVYVDTALVGEDWGRQGPSPTFTSTEPAREEGNDDRGPYGPRSSLNDVLFTQNGVFEEPVEPPVAADSPADEAWEH